MLECEHCKNQRKLTSGYHDDHYHDNVIPAMCCQVCGKNRAGDVTGRKDNAHVPMPSRKDAK
jgi:hypothetical protein